MLQALQIRKDIIEFQRTRVITQVVMDKDDAKQAFEDYRDAQMPYLKKIRATDRQQHIKNLMSEVAKGPMVIKPVMQKQVQSKLKTRIIKRNEEEVVQAQRRISKKIGGIV